MPGTPAVCRQEVCSCVVIRGPMTPTHHHGFGLSCVSLLEAELDRITNNRPVQCCGWYLNAAAADEVQNSSTKRCCLKMRLLQTLFISSSINVTIIELQYNYYITPLILRNICNFTFYQQTVADNHSSCEIIKTFPHNYIFNGKHSTDNYHSCQRKEGGNFISLRTKITNTIIRQKSV